MIMSFLCKTILLGDSETQRRILRRKASSDFSNQATFTAVDFGLRESFVDETIVKFQLWNLINDRTRFVFFLGAHAGVVFFNIGNRSSFDQVPDLISELWKKNGRGPIPVGLVGFSTNTKIRVNSEEIESYCKELSMTPIQTIKNFQVPYVEVNLRDEPDLDSILVPIGRAYLAMVANRE